MAIYHADNGTLFLVIVDTISEWLFAAMIEPPLCWQKGGDSNASLAFQVTDHMNLTRFATKAHSQPCWAGAPDSCRPDQPELKSRAVSKLRLQGNVPTSLAIVN